MEDESPIIIYQFFDLSNTKYFQDRLRELFKKSGHDRPIEFRIWNCYYEIPDRDGDIYFYDTLMLNWLCSNDYLQRVPEIIDRSETFEWIYDSTKFNKNNYGIPFIACLEALICKKEDYKEKYTKEDLYHNVAGPMRSVIEFYLMEYCVNHQTKDCLAFDGEINQEKRNFIKKYTDMLGGKKVVLETHITSTLARDRFISGEAKYYLGFSETLRFFPKGEYKVEHANFSDEDNADFNMFYIDYVSIGKNVKEEKLLDCYDILEIMNSSEFQYEICNPLNELSYMLPCNKKTYEMLVKDDIIYKDFYKIMDDNRNFACRFPKNYYETIAELEKKLCDIIESFED